MEIHIDRLDRGKDDRGVFFGTGSGAEGIAARFRFVAFGSEPEPGM